MAALKLTHNPICLPCCFTSGFLFPSCWKKKGLGRTPIKDNLNVCASISSVAHRELKSAQPFRMQAVWLCRYMDHDRSHNSWDVSFTSLFRVKGWKRGNCLGVNLKNVWLWDGIMKFRCFGFGMTASHKMLLDNKSCLWRVTLMKSGWNDERSNPLLVSKIVYRDSVGLDASNSVNLLLPTCRAS